MNSKEGRTAENLYFPVMSSNKTNNHNIGVDRKNKAAVITMDQDEESIEKNCKVRYSVAKIKKKNCDLGSAKAQNVTNIGMNVTKSTV